jgi:hypothetical protein
MDLHVWHMYDVKNQNKIKCHVSNDVFVFVGIFITWNDEL